MDMQTSFHAQDDNIIVASQQDVAPIIDSCRVKADMGDVGGNEMRHAATIPMVVVEDYCTRNGITFQEFTKNKAHIKRMLNDPDLSCFRVWKGKV